MRVDSVGEFDRILTTPTFMGVPPDAVFWCTHDGRTLSWRAIEEEAREVRDALRVGCALACSINWCHTDLVCDATGAHIRCVGEAELCEHPAT